MGERCEGKTWRAREGRLEASQRPGLQDYSSAFRGRAAGRAQAARDPAPSRAGPRGHSGIPLQRALCSRLASPDDR